MNLIIIFAILTAAAAADFKVNTWDFQRIVNGDIAEPHSIPYQVALHIQRPNSERRNFCGGTLISQNYVLTAAHCADGAEEIEVWLGAHNLEEHEDTQFRINCTEFTVHELWDYDSLQNDIALIKLPKSAPLTESIQLAKLPSHSEANVTFENFECRTSGWGKITDESTVVSTYLRYVDLTVISNDICRAIYGSSIQEGHICSASAKFKGPCNGDSGGPLVVEGDKQVGITSFVSDFGCESGFPAGYCRTSQYLDWIEKHSDAVIQP